MLHFYIFSLARLKSLALIGLFAMATGVSNGLSAQSKPATSKGNPDPTMGESLKNGPSSATLAGDSKKDSSAVLNGPVILAADTVFSVQEKLMGHTSSTESLAISPDGKWLATGGWDRKILLYSIDTLGMFKLVKTFTGHNGAVTCLTFDAASTLLASGSKDFSLRVVNILDGSLVFQTMDHRDAITAVEFEATGKFVMSASMDGTIRLYDIANPTNNQKPRLYTYGKPLNDLITAPNGKTFFVANNGNNNVESIDFTGKVYQTFAGNHTMPVNCLGLSNNKQMMVTGGNDKSVVIWDIATSKPIRTLLGHTWKVNSVAFTKNDQYLVSTGNDGEIRVWDVNTGACVSVQKNLISRATEAKFTPNNKLMIVAGKMSAQGATFGAIVYRTPPIWTKAKPAPVKPAPVKSATPARSRK